MNHDVKDLKLAKEGKLRIEWANQNMPVLNRIKARFEKEKPLKFCSENHWWKLQRPLANIFWNV